MKAGWGGILTVLLSSALTAPALASPQQDALQAIASGRPADEVRNAYLEQWAFFLSVLEQGIYRRD